MLKNMMYTYKLHSTPPTCEQIEVHHSTGERQDPRSMKIVTLRSELHVAQQALEHEREVTEQLRAQLLQIQASVTSIHVVGVVGVGN